MQIWQVMRGWSSVRFVEIAKASLESRRDVLRITGHSCRRDLFVYTTVGLFLKLNLCFLFIYWSWTCSVGGAPVGWALVWDILWAPSPRNTSPEPEYANWVKKLVVWWNTRSQSSLSGLKWPKRSGGRWRWTLLVNVVCDLRQNGSSTAAYVILISWLLCFSVQKWGKTVRTCVWMVS